MSQVVRTSLTCPRCGTPFTAIIEQIIDVGRDPQAKQRFLSGRINMITCPQCGHTFAIGTPLVYHDPQKELLLIHVPMQINIDQQERERLIGDLTRRVTDSIPAEQRKAYLLQPKQAMTVPGMIDMILDADGITQAMRDAQREKIRVMEMFLQVRPDAWVGILDQQAEHIDHEFLQMMLVQAENAAQTGHGEMAEMLMHLYNFMVQNTEIGQELTAAAQAQEATVREVAQYLQDLGEDITREDFMDLVLDWGDDEERLQALVGLMRPAFDYQFFQDLTGEIEQAEGEEKEWLTELRAMLSELTQIIDQQTQAVLQRAADTLRVIMSSEDLDAAIRPRLQEIDDTFLAVLQANMQAAQQHDDQRTFDRLVEVQEKVLEVLRDAAPPQIKLINEMLMTPNDEAAHALIADRAPDFGPELVELMDVIAADLNQNGQGDQAARLQVLRPFVAEHIGDAPTYEQHHDHDHDHGHDHDHPHILRS